MKMFYLKPLLLSFCMVWAFSSSLTTYAQPVSGSFYDDEGLRYVGINELIDRTYLRDSTYTYVSAEEAAETWLLKEKTLYAYDNQGREVLREMFSNQNSTWKGYKQQKRTYLSDFLAEEEELVRCENDLEYRSSVKRKFNYNYIGLLSEITSYDYKKSKWIANSRTNYTYNSDYLISEQESYKWIASEMTWEKISRYIYSYNNLNDITEEIFQVWDDSLNVWTNKTSRVYEYNDSNELISTTRSTWVDHDTTWVRISVLSFEYNDEGQFLNSAQKSLNTNSEFVLSQSESANYDEEGNIGIVIKSAWDDSSGVWDNYQKQEHYWSEYNRGNLKPGMNDIECFFANPYTIGLPLYCSSLKPDEVYTVSIYDLNGKFYYSDQFLGSSSFRIKRSIEPGLYLFHISGGLDSHTEKVFIKN